MRQTSGTRKSSGEKIVKDIKRATRKQYSSEGWCQTNSNQSQFTPKYRNLCRTKQAPLGEGGGAVELEIVSAVEGTFLIEMIADGGMNGGEFL